MAYLKKISFTHLTNYFSSFLFLKTDKESWKSETFILAKILKKIIKYFFNDKSPVLITNKPIFHTQKKVRQTQKKGYATLKPFPSPEGKKKESPLMENLW